MPSSPTVLAGGQLGLLSRSEVAVAGAAAEDLLEALGRVPDPRDLDGVLVTADALHAQREHATWLHERGAHYLVSVKCNQPSLLRQLRSLPWKQVPLGHVQDGRGHGRIEKRIVKVVTVGAGTGPHVMAALRNLVISILRMAGHVSIAAALRHTA
jgi:Transposase DDE domain